MVGRRASKWVKDSFLSSTHLPFVAGDWQYALDSFCFSGRIDTFQCNSRQCTDLSDYLDSLAKSLHHQFTGDEEVRARIRKACTLAVNEICNAIADAKLFLHDCSLKAGFWQTVKSIKKLDTREAYDVLLPNLIWSKAGLQLAILYAEATDPNNPHLNSARTAIMKNLALELHWYSRKETRYRLDGDREAFYHSVKNLEEGHLQLYLSKAQKKYLRFLVEKSKANQKSSLDTYESGDGSTQLDDFRIDPLDLLPYFGSKQTFVGVGSHGEVHRYRWLKQTVAVKVFQNMKEQNAVFPQEVSLLAHLRNPLEGWCWNGNDCMLVMELAHIDLQKVITSGKPLSLNAAVDIMLQISEGMKYLHAAQRVIHRDIKPSNVLLEPSSVKEMAAKGHTRVRICDFGLAKVKQLSAADRSQYTTLRQGTSYYRAPEVLLGDEEIPAKYTRKADVFSFGITCSEILGGLSATSCYENLDRKEMRKKMLEGVRPSLPENCPSHLADLIKRCWHTDPDSRPPFSDISSTLTYIKFIWMRVLDVQRVRPYSSVLRRVSGDPQDTMEDTTEWIRSTGLRSDQELDDELRGHVLGNPEGTMQGMEEWNRHVGSRSDQELEDELRRASVDLEDELKMACGYSASKELGDEQRRRVSEEYPENTTEGRRGEDMQDLDLIKM